MKELSPIDPIDMHAVAEEIFFEQPVEEDEPEEDLMMLEVEFDDLDEENEIDEIYLRRLLGPYESIPAETDAHRAIMDFFKMQPVIIYTRDVYGWSEFAIPRENPELYNSPEYRVLTDDMNETRTFEDIQRIGTFAEKTMCEYFTIPRNSRHLHCKDCSARFLYWPTAFRHYQLLHLELTVE